jgi:hypothetical protein
MTWTQPNMSGKYPSKRYQHFSFLINSKQVLVYGGINRMTALQDIHILDLGKCTRQRDYIRDNVLYHTPHSPFDQNYCFDQMERCVIQNSVFLY